MATSVGTLSPNRRALAGLTLAFVVSRIIIHALGLNFDASSLRGPSPAWQLLNPALLRSQLLSSVWHLHSQPPLFNVACGLLLRFPGGWQPDLAMVAYAGMGLVLTLCAYQTMVDLRVPARAALVLSLLLMVSPAMLMFENNLSYAYPTATAFAVLALCVIRSLRTGRWWWQVGACTAAATVVLLNSTYQIVWLIVVVVLLGMALRRNWRRFVAAAIIPVMVVGGWYVKNAVQFGTPTTSSWLGMNLARTTIVAAPKGLVDRLVQNGTLTPIAAVHPFSPVQAYVPRFASAPNTGVPALDQWTSGNGTNFNNEVYVKVSRLYLHDDLAFIAAEPGRYASTVVKAGSLWFVPAESFFPSVDPLAGWSRVYDVAVLWQPKTDNRYATLVAELAQRGPSPSEISYALVAVYALALIGGPIVAWRRRRDKPFAATVAVLWCTTAYAYVVTSLVEFDENQRFRFELGPLALILAAVVATTVVRAARERRTGNGAPTLTDGSVSSSLSP